MRTDPLIRAGIVLGIGLGGFFDGILLHQILGWHHVVCLTETCQPRSVSELQWQTVQDGWFHLAMLVITTAGIALLFHAAGRQPETWHRNALSGALIMGWGIFNLLEGLINHQLLGLHHVLPGHRHEFLFDMLFLLSGVVLIFGGRVLSRRIPSRHKTPTPIRVDGSE